MVVTRMLARANRRALASLAALALAVIVAGCAPDFPEDSTWRASESHSTKVTLLRDGSARLVDLDLLDPPPGCDLELPHGEATGRWARNSDGRYLITIPGGEIVWGFDKWFGQPNYEKAFINPCNSEVVWYFAREIPPP